MHADDKTAALGFLKQVEEQCEGWEMALDQAVLLLEGLPEIDMQVLYAVAWELPESHGGVLWSFDKAVVEAAYNQTVEENADNIGALVRMFKIDAREMIDTAVDGEIWAMSSELAPADLPEGYEVLKASRNMPDETLAPEQVEKLAHEWALSHGIHSYDGINDDIMEELNISFRAADQITLFLDTHTATAVLTFGPVA